MFLEDGKIWEPPLAAPILKPFYTSAVRFNATEGGRGSAKSHTIADVLVSTAAQAHVRAACMREVQNSIKDSSKQLIEDKIKLHGLEGLFRVTDKEITCPATDSLFTFRGLQNHTASTIKSLEGYTHAWYEEAQTLTQRSLDLATPTFRSNSKQFFSYNRDEIDDPVHTFFEENEGDPDFLRIRCNYWNNRYFPAELARDMERDKRRNRDKYLHIWEGLPRKNSEARVFKHVRSFHFDTPSDAMFLHGADWGFSNDPTTLIRSFTGRLVNGEAVYDPEGKTLFVDHELYKVGVEIDDTPKFFDGLVFGQPCAARKWQVRADSSRPETISYLQRHDYPLLVRARKGKNSVEEGVAFLQDYDIVIHPRCKYAVDEFTMYEYKIDKKTSAITRELPDEKNHIIDAERYAIEPLRGQDNGWYVGE